MHEVFGKDTVYIRSGGSIAIVTQFDKDLKRQEKRSKSLVKIHAVIETLRNRRLLESKHKDNALGGDWKGWRDCHIEPDWLLIYRRDDVRVELGRTGSHADLFE